MQIVGSTARFPQVPRNPLAYQSSTIPKITTDRVTFGSNVPGVEMIDEEQIIELLEWELEQAIQDGDVAVQVSRHVMLASLQKDQSVEHWQAILELTQQRGHSRLNSALQIKACYRLAEDALQRDDQQSVEEYYDLALDAAESVGAEDIVEIDFSLLMADSSSLKVGKKIRILESALEIVQTISDVEREIDVRLALGERYPKNTEEKFEHFRLALLLADKIGDERRILSALVKYEQFKYALSETELLRMSSLAEKWGDRLAESRGLQALARNSELAGKLEEAAEYATRCLKTVQEMNDEKQILDTQVRLGSIHTKLGNFPKALGYFLDAQKSLDSKIIDEIFSLKMRIRILLGLGEICVVMGGYPEALVQYGQAFDNLERLRQNGQKAIFLQTAYHIQMGKLHLAQGHQVEARQFFQTALDLSDKEDRRREVQELLGQLPEE